MGAQARKLVAHTGLEPVISALRGRIRRFVLSWRKLALVVHLLPSEGLYAVA